MGAPDTAAGDLDYPYLKRFFIDPYVYLAPQPLFRLAVLAGIPLPVKDLPSPASTPLTSQVGSSGS